MSNFNPLYRKFIDDANKITPNQMVRGNFYIIKEYQYIDGHRGSYSASSAPIIYTLFVSKSKDIVHAIKVSNVNPQLIKKFFGKFVNEDINMDNTQLVPKNKLPKPEPTNKSLLKE